MRFSVPKGNPAGREAAMKFIDYALNPEGQAKVFEIVGMSPSNPAATALIPEADRRGFSLLQALNVAVNLRTASHVGISIASQQQRSFTSVFPEQ